MSAIRILSAVALGALVLAGCSSAAEPVGQGAPPPAPQPQFDPLAWGETYTYADGSTMRIAEPTEWSSAEECEYYGAEYCESMMRVSFTFGNGTAMPTEQGVLGTMWAFVQIDGARAQELQVDTYNTEGLSSFTIPCSPVCPVPPISSSWLPLPDRL